MIPKPLARLIIGKAMVATLAAIAAGVAIGLYVVVPVDAMTGTIFVVNLILVAFNMQAIRRDFRHPEIQRELTGHVVLWLICSMSNGALLGMFIGAGNIGLKPFILLTNAAIMALCFQTIKKLVLPVIGEE